METLWRIELLGELRVVGADRVITRFRSRQTGALLAYLAFYLDRAHPREVLLEMFWPGEELETARDRLRVALSSLRRQLEPPGVPGGSVLRAGRHSVQLNPASVSSDVAAFEAALGRAGRAADAAGRSRWLTAAIEQYRGELLPGYYEAWIMPERQRVTSLYFQAAGALIHCREQAGDLPGALEIAGRAVAADPLHEEAQQALIRLLAAAGQPAAARRQYRQFAQLLAAELGEEPSPATRELIECLSGQDSPGAGRPAPTGPPRSTPALPVTDASPAPPSILPLIDAAIVLVARITAPAFPSQAEMLASLRLLLLAVFQLHGGQPLRQAEDLVAVAFSCPADALAAALAGQRTLAVQRWPEGVEPPAVRMALHADAAGSGRSESPGLQHAAGMADAAHAGQILCSAAAASRLGELGAALPARLDDRGVHRLAAGEGGERIFQVSDPEQPRPEFPLLLAETGPAWHLPTPITRFFGREEEIARLVGALGHRPSAVRGDGPAAVDGRQPAADSPDTDTRQPTAPPLRSCPRLITLTGPGGSGKTRLAAEVARRLVERGPGVVRWVPLVDLVDPGLIGDAIRGAMRLPPLPQVPALEQIVQTLGEMRQPVLLILDNFEQLVDGGAPLVHDLLQQAPNLRCLITSRQLLSLSGEREFRVDPLPVPGQRDEGKGMRDEGPTERVSSLIPHPSSLMHFASVQLFVDRAQAARADFQVTRGNARVIAELCRRLEGIPLAIELAAARAGVLMPPRMLELLGRRFEFLTSRRRDLHARHQTLRATLDWSYRLLPPELQRFFARLSVFRGGWTLEAAAAILDFGCWILDCSDSGEDAGQSGPMTLSDPIQNPTSKIQNPQALDRLEELRRCSLIVAESSGVEMRYRMLETLREYAAEQLAPEEREAVARRHADYFRALVEAAVPGLRSEDQGLWLDRLEREHDNLRAALEWCAASSEVEAGLRMASRLPGFWMGRGYEREGLARLTALLALPGSEGTAARALALTRAGAMAQEQGDLARARALQEESLALARELGDPEQEARALNNLGCVLNALGEKEAAVRSWQQNLALARQLGDRGGVAVALANLSAAAIRDNLAAAHELAEECAAISREIGHDYVLSDALAVLGEVARRSGAPERARSFFEESLAIGRHHGNKHISHRALDHLARLAREQGDLTVAKAAYRESLAICHDLGRPKFLAGSLKGLGWVAAADGQTRRSVRLFAATSSLYADPADSEGDETVLARLRAELGETGFAAAWEQGRRTPLDEIVTAALTDAPIE